MMHEWRPRYSLDFGFRRCCLRRASSFLWKYCFQHRDLPIRYLPNFPSAFSSLPRLKSHSRENFMTAADGTAMTLLVPRPSTIDDDGKPFEYRIKAALKPAIDRRRSVIAFLPLAKLESASFGTSLPVCVSGCRDLVSL